MLLGRRSDGSDDSDGDALDGDGAPPDGARPSNRDRAVAAALDDLPFACGLATLDELEGDVTDDPLVPIDGVLVVRAVVPSPARLAAYGARS